MVLGRAVLMLFPRLWGRNVQRADGRGRLASGRGRDVVGVSFRELKVLLSSRAVGVGLVRRGVDRRDSVRDSG